MARDDTTGIMAGIGEEPDRSLADTELEEALRYCEKILRQVDGSNRRIALTQAFAIVLSAVVALAGTLFLMNSHIKSEAIPVAVSVIVAACVAIAVTAARLAAKFREQLQRDELVMVSIVNTQRERMPLISRREKWSVARQEFMRRRLERFPIGAGSVQTLRRRGGRP
jgi:hypothetical protein